MEVRFMRHFLSTLAYRTSIAVNDSPAHYPDFEAGEGVRTPLAILIHMSQVLQNALRAYGETQISSQAGDWEQAVREFYSTLEQLDKYVAQGIEPQTLSAEQILQGPLSDAMTHVGQLLLLRRLAGAPVKGGHYMRAKIEAGEFQQNGQ